MTKEHLYTYKGFDNIFKKEESIVVLPMSKESVEIIRSYTDKYMVEQYLKDSIELGISSERFFLLQIEDDKIVKFDVGRREDFSMKVEETEDETGDLYQVAVDLQDSLDQLTYMYEETNYPDGYTIEKVLIDALIMMQDIKNDILLKLEIDEEEFREKLFE